ncbi:MAG: DUF4430 domain-containing protein [Promethearchaeota archaeon]
MSEKSSFNWKGTLVLMLIGIASLVLISSTLLSMQTGKNGDGEPSCYCEGKELNNITLILWYENGTNLTFSNVSVNNTGFTIINVTRLILPVKYFRCGSSLYVTSLKGINGGWIAKLNGSNEESNLFNTCLKNNSLVEWFYQAHVVQNLTIKVRYGNGTMELKQDLFIDDENVTAFKLLADNFNISFKSYPNGLFVEEINDQKNGWTYSINGIHPSYASNYYCLKNGDIMEWNQG